MSGSREGVEVAVSQHDARSRIGAAVLAGGRSTRMGSDKRAARVRGQPLLARAVEALATLSDDVQVIVSDPADTDHVHRLLGELPSSDEVRVGVDLRPGNGPVAGLEAALAGTDRDLLVVVATDHPYLAPPVLAELVRRLEAAPDRDAAALVTDRGPQPLVGAYRRRALPRIRALLDAGERRATAVLDALDPIHLDDWRELDPSGRTARDVDTPADLDAAATAAGHPDDRATEDDTDVHAAGDHAHDAPEHAPGHRTRAMRISRVRDGVGEVDVTDEIIVEEPLELRAAGPGQEPRALLTTLRTPGHDHELAAGWLWTEGLVRPAGIERFTLGDPVTMARPDDQLTVWLTHPLDLDSRARRYAAATASCGVCGRASIDELTARASPIPAEAPGAEPLPWELIAGLAQRLRATQPLFARTGGLHATALATADGDLATLREDVGRHNALDAAIGAHVLADELPLPGRIAVLSGRIGFELVAKVAVAGIPVLVAVGAPTDLAVRTAERLGVTLVGFLRGGDGNLYTHPGRIALPPSR
ncbi:MAG: formate dehydrogenase accessory sulfurtransferase FdhD [Nitriliruptoraceae bacterium]